MWINTNGDCGFYREICFNPGTNWHMLVAQNILVKFCENVWPIGACGHGGGEGVNIAEERDTEKFGRRVEESGEKSVDIIGVQVVFLFILEGYCWC